MVSFQAGVEWKMSNFVDVRGLISRVSAKKNDFLGGLFWWFPVFFSSSFFCVCFWGGVFALRGWFCFSRVSTTFFLAVFFGGGIPALHNDGW